MRRFELNAANLYGVELPIITDGSTIQFMAENVDHNSITLDGRGTFHGMGIITSVSPGVSMRKTFHGMKLV